MQQVDRPLRPAMLKHFAAPRSFRRSKELLDPRLEIPPVRQQVNPIEREQRNR
jgi:hypothetical protein